VPCESRGDPGGWRARVRSVATAAAVIALGNVASRLLGLVREQVMAALFGATGSTDAFVAASAVPQMVYDLLVGGAISAALVPTFVDVADDDERLGALVSSVLTVVALALTVVALMLGLAAPLVVAVLAAGFDAEQQAEAATMVRVMLVAVVLQGLAGILMSVLYARRRNALPAFAVAVYNGGIIVAALAMHQWLGAYALVVGVVVGAVGQLLLQLPGLGRVRLRPRLDRRQPELRAISRLYLPVVLGMLVTVVGIVYDRYLASGLAEGSLSVMNYATRLIQFPLGLVGTAVSFAVLAPLARHAGVLAQFTGDTGGPVTAGSAVRGAGAEGTAARGEGSEVDDARGADAHAAYRQTLRFGVRMVIVLMVPATVGLMVLSEPLVRLLFERGRFGDVETARTALVLLAYAPQLPFTALDQVFIVAFYARRDTRTPVLVGVATVLLYMVSANALMSRLDVAGLALANAIQNSAHGLILLALLERAGVGVMDRRLVGFACRVVAASAVMGASVWWTAALVLTGGEAALDLAASLIGLAALAGAVYFVALELLGVRDGRDAVLAIVAKGRARSALP